VDGRKGESLSAAPAENCMGPAAVEYLGQDCTIACSARRVRDAVNLRLGQIPNLNQWR
jgi:hypothetical protein